MAFWLNRRAFLRGLGAGLALPALDCMLNDRGWFHRVGHAANVAPPLRYVGVMFQNGLPLNLWQPTVAADGSFALPASVAALQSVKADVNMVYGLQANALAMGFAHTDGQLGIWTGSPRALTNNDPNQPGHATAASVEQVLSQKMNYAAIAASLTKDLGDRHDANQSSWKGNNVRTDSIYRTPSSLAAKLFAQATPSTQASTDATAETGRQKSILDFYAKESNRLASKLGQADRARLDQHLTAIEEIEQSLTVVRATCSAYSGTVPADAGLTDDVAMPAMAKLIAYAFRCDVARYVLFDVKNAPPFSPDTSDMADHDTSHLVSDARNTSYYNKKAAYFAMIINELKSSSEGANTVLYNSVCVACNDLGESVPNHILSNYKVLQAGQAGGRIKTGRYLVFPGQPMSNLHATLMTAVGCDTPKFGVDGTGLLSGYLS